MAGKRRCMPYLVRYQKADGTWLDGPRYQYGYTAVQAARSVAQRLGYVAWRTAYAPACSCHPSVTNALAAHRANEGEA